MFPCEAPIHRFLFYPQASQAINPHRLLCSITSCMEDCYYVSLLFFKLNITKDLLFMRFSLQVPYHLFTVLHTLFPGSQCPFCIVAAKTRHTIPGVIHSVQHRAVLSLLMILTWRLYWIKGNGIFWQPWLMLNLWSTKTSKSFSQGYLLSQVPPTLHLCIFFLPKCRIFFTYFTVQSSS